ncbi:MAG: electron transfer flavoprotein subunit alpha/FixB family protein [Anaerolineae bacterium]
MWDELLVPMEEAAEAMHVWAVAEANQGGIAPISYELLGAARDLADMLAVRTEAVLLGKDLDGLADELVWRGAESVYVLDDPRLSGYQTDPYTQVLTHLIRERNPEVVLLGATDLGNDLAPRLAQELDTGLLPHCTKLEVDQVERALLGTRPAYDGELMITTVCPKKRPQIATVRPGTMEPFPPDRSRVGDIEQISAQLEGAGARSKVVEVVDEVRKPELQQARIVVAGGRGVGTGGFDLLEELAHELGAAVGASRGAFDEGWIGKEYWVGGAGGTAVAPDLYVACGISGALQHYLGIKDARFIVAINRDREAPIFKFADVGIIGDVQEIVPALIEQLRAKGN